MLILPFTIIHGHVFPVTGVEEALCLRECRPAGHIPYLSVLCYFSVSLQDCSKEDYCWQNYCTVRSLSVSLSLYLCSLARGQPALVDGSKSLLKLSYFHTACQLPHFPLVNESSSQEHQSSCLSQPSANRGGILMLVNLAVCYWCCTGYYQATLSSSAEEVIKL